MHHPKEGNMAVIVTVYRLEPTVLHFQVEGFKLPGVFEDFLDARLRAEIDADEVLIVNVDDYDVTINHSLTINGVWYVKVIDAVIDSVGGEHEVLSRTATWS